MLTALAEHADAPLRFAAVARAAGVSPATCHAILASLADAGFVARDESTKTYSLGPALIPLASGAARALRDAGIARPALASLVARTGLACSVAEAVGDTIVVVAVAAPDGVAPPVREGAGVPFAPPFGAIHVAWSPDAAVEAWIRRSPRPTMRPDRLRAVVADHRRTRVAVAPLTAASDQVRDALSVLAIGDHASSPEVRRRTLDLLATIDRLDYTSGELARPDPVAVNTVTAPVLGPDGRVAFALAAHVADPAVAAARLRSLVGAVRRGADAASAQLAAAPSGTRAAAGMGETG